MGLFKKLFGKKIEASNNFHLLEDKTSEAINATIAYNRYGAYCVPLSTQHRTLNQKILGGEVFEPDTIAYIRNNAGNGDVIHAGTFFGDFLPGISSGINGSAKVWAFEPNPESYACARITMLLNHIENVELQPFGLGERSSTSWLQTQNNKGVSLGGSSSITSERSSKNLYKEIGLVAIDDVIPADRQISILQLDVEGYEEDALKGALKTIKRCLPTLILETDKGICSTKWFADNILSLGYEIGEKIHYNRVIHPPSP